MSPRAPRGKTLTHNFERINAGYAVEAVRTRIPLQASGDDEAAADGTGHIGCSTYSMDVRLGPCA